MVLYGTSSYGMGAYYGWLFSTDGCEENGERMRTWRENEEIERIWRENEEMDRG